MLGVVIVLSGVVLSGSGAGLLARGGASPPRPTSGFQPVLLDRIAIVVNNQPVKHTDIERDLRVTEFLNGEPLNVSAEARKSSANRLIDQALIRREIQIMQYPPAKPEDVQKLLDQVRNKAPLSRYGITPGQLRKQLTWQLTVLNFINLRFRPAVLISDADVEQYYQQHRPQFGARTLEDVRGQIEQQLTGERVNQQFFTWLDEARKNATIEYLEADLK